MVAQIDRDYLRTGIGNTVVRAVSYSLEGRPLTTRPRWVNPVVRQMLRGLAALSSDTPDRPMFIVGLGRSGTTLLGQLLSVHPDVGWLNEPKLLWHLISDDEDVIGSWDASSRGRLRLGSEDADPETIARARSLAGGYLRLTGRTRLLDKYPELIFRLDFVRRIYPDAKFLCLQRRAAASTASIAQWSVEHGTNGADWWGLNGKKWRALHGELISTDPVLSTLADVDPQKNEPALMAALEWLLAAEASVRALDHDDVHLVRYEDLTDDPIGTLGTLARFAGLAHSTTMDAFALAKCRPAAAPRSLAESLPEPVRDRVQAAEHALGYH